MKMINLSTHGFTCIFLSDKITKNTIYSDLLIPDFTIWGLIFVFLSVGYLSSMFISVYSPIRSKILLLDGILSFISWTSFLREFISYYTFSNYILIMLIAGYCLLLAILSSLRLVKIYLWKKK
jgi:hypothetical protein